MIQIRTTDADDYFTVVTDEPDVIVALTGDPNAEKADEVGGLVSFTVRADLGDYVDFGSGDAEG